MIVIVSILSSFLIEEVILELHDNGILDWG